MKYARYIRVIGILMILLMATANAAAEDSLSLSIQEVIIYEDGRLDLIVHTPSKSELSLSGLTLSVDGKTVPVDTLESLSNAKISTTWMVLSDRSTVGATKPLKALVSGIIDMMKTGDNGGIVVTGNGYEQMTLSEDQVGLKTLVESDLLKRNNQERNLNATISATIQYLNQFNQVRDRACLVIISNGENTNETGMTTEELQQIVKESNITIYTFVFQEEEPRNSLINQFEALARLSCGGIATSIRHNANEAAVLELLTGIQENERQFRVVSCNPAVAGVSGREISLSFADGDYTVTASVQLTAEEEEAYSRIFAAINTPVSDAEPTFTVAPTIEPEATVEPTSIATVEPTLALTENSTLPPIAKPEVALNAVSMTIVISMIAIVIMLLLALLHIRKKKTNEAAESESHKENATNPDMGEDFEHRNVLETKLPSLNDTEVYSPRKALLQVTLVPDDGSSSSIYQADMGEELIIGRDPKRAKVLISHSDSSISGMHLRLSYKNGVMQAKDISRNGTYVNGKRITDSVILHSGDQIRLANSMFIITWRVY